MGIYPFVLHTQGKTYECVRTACSFFANRLYVKRDHHWTLIDKPLDVEVAFSHDHFLFIPQSDWTTNNQTYPSGIVLAIEIDQYLKGDRSFSVLFAPTERTALEGIERTQNFLILNILDNMSNRVVLWKRDAGSWVKTELEVPHFGALEVTGIDSNESDGYFLTTSDYLTPTSLWMGDLTNQTRTQIQSLPSYFSAENLEIKQYETVSKDGTQIPYFQVGRKDLLHDGSNPTLLFPTI